MSSPPLSLHHGIHHFSLPVCRPPSLILAHNDLVITHRLSIPAGAVYWTVQEGIWSPVTGSSDGQQRLQAHNHQLVLLRQKVVHAVDPYIRPYLTSITASKWLQIPDPRGYWNCGVKVTVRKIADFDAAVQLKRLSQLLADQMKPVETEAKKEAGK